MRKKSDHFNECLERIRQGEDLESCLKDYPKEAEELRFLLRTADGITRLAETMKPRSEFIAQTQANLGNAYESQYLSWKARIGGVLKPVRRFAAVAAIVLAVLVGTFTLGLTLSVLTSEDTMPGETLYSVKLATEQIRLILAFSDDSKIGYLTQFAETRIAEIVYATERGEVDKVEAALERLERNLAEVEEIVTLGKANDVIAASEHESLELERIESTV